MRADLSPRLCARRILVASPACDGTSVPTPNVAGDRRLEGWSRVWRDLVQEARSDRLRPSCRHTDLAAGCCDQLSCVAVLPGQPEHGQAAKARTGTQIAARGCRKATLGTVRSHGEPGQALEEVSRPPGAGETAPRLSSTAPASRRFICADTRGSRASGRNGACAEWMAGAEQCAGPPCWKHALRHDREASALARAQAGLLRTVQPASTRRCQTFCSAPWRATSLTPIARVRSVGWAPPLAALEVCSCFSRSRVRASAWR